MTDTGERILEALHARDGRRQLRDHGHKTKRDGQGLRLVGPSACDACPRAVVYDMLGLEPVNVTDTISAIIGTAVHTAAEEAVDEADPFGDWHISEVPLPPLPEFGLAAGRCDLYRTDIYSVADLKTIKKEHKRYFPSPGKIGQVMIYGHRLIAAGYRVDTVELVGLCRNGTEKDIAHWWAPYSQQQAEWWLTQLQRLRVSAERYMREGENHLLPKPQRPRTNFCSKFCVHFDPEERCPGG